MKLTKEESQEILWGGDIMYEVVYDEIIDTSRWSEIHRIIIKDKETNKYYEDSYSRGLTEMQDESPWEYREPQWYEVEPYEKTIIDYRRVNNE